MLRYLTRIPGIRRLWSKFPLGSVALRTEYDIWERPAYAYGVYSAARLAQSLEINNFTVIEFGVAGGNGLLILERIAERISISLGVHIEILGFDTGRGMPNPQDYRDLPHVYQEGFYKMEIEKLKSRLKTAQLIIGDIFDTIPCFFGNPDLPPVGFVAFDLDYYSSTKKAFRIFEGAPLTRLPRVFCYFDDTIYPERACHNELCRRALCDT